MNRIAVVVLAACGSSSSPLDEQPKKVRIDAGPPDAPADAFYKLTGFASGEEAARAYMAAVEKGDVEAMRATMVDLPANEHYYDCSRRSDYNLARTTEKSIKENVDAGRKARTIFQKTPKATLELGAYTETKRMPRVVDEISGVCRVRVPLDVVIGDLGYDLVDGKQHTKDQVTFIFVHAEGVYRINTVVWI